MDSSAGKNQEDGLGPTEGGYRLLFERNPQPMWVFDPETLRFLAVNDAAIERYGYSRDEFLAMTLRDIRPPEDVAAFEQQVERTAGTDVFGEEWRHRLRDGTIIDVLIFADDMPFDGRPGRLVVAIDITDRNRASAELERRAAQQSSVAALGARALEGIDLSDLFDEAVEMAARELGVEFCELLEESEDRDALMLRAGVGWRPGLVRWAQSPVGSSFHAGFTWGSLGQVVIEDFTTETRFEPTPLLREHGVTSGISVIVGRRARPLAMLGAYTAQRRSFSAEDVNYLQSVANLLAEVIERQKAEDQIRHDSLHDALTGLPNRTLLLERLDQSARRAQRSGKSSAVLFVDIDNFKLVNDGLGHAAGDELLLGVALRLQAPLRNSDTVARVGGDEFVVVCEEVQSEVDAIELAERLLRTFSEPFLLSGRGHDVSASIGIALEAGTIKAENLVRDADAAMYLAKERGGGRFELFDAAMRDRSLHWLQTERDLRKALDRDELSNVYQPLVTVSGEIIGFETLLRWKHPERGAVSPADFIPIAEKSGLIVPIGEQVLKAACLEANSWRRNGGDGDPYVSVNLSPRQVAQPQLVENIGRILSESGLSPERLHLELTETALLDDAHNPLETLSRLKELGVNLVLDDFGTGYSSLAYVKRFPIDALKIDRSFTTGLGRDAGDEAIVSAVLSIGTALGVKVIAEGVETAEQLERLESLGCCFAQGYFFSPPLPPSELAGLLTHQTGMQAPPILR